MNIVQHCCYPSCNKTGVCLAVQGQSYKAQMAVTSTKLSWYLERTPVNPRVLNYQSIQGIPLESMSKQMTKKEATFSLQDHDQYMDKVGV